jgi:hypothetical protein
MAWPDRGGRLTGGCHQEVAALPEWAVKGSSAFGEKRTFQPMLTVKMCHLLQPGSAATKPDKRLTAPMAATTIVITT